MAAAQASGISFADSVDGILKALTKTVVETALDEELTDHLGYDKHDPAGRSCANSRNGFRSKTVLTDTVGEIELNRRGVSGDSDCWEGWSHVREHHEAVPG